MRCSAVLAALEQGAEGRTVTYLLGNEMHPDRILCLVVQTVAGRVWRASIEFKTKNELWSDGMLCCTVPRACAAITALMLIFGQGC